MPQPSSRLSGIVPSGKGGWEVHFAAMDRKQAGEDIIMLSVGDHDFDTPSETVEACVVAVRGGRHHYTQLPGLPRLRQAVAKVSTRTTGVATGADEVIATPGGQSALYAAVQGVLDPGDHAIVLAPYYATYPGTFRAAGAERRRLVEFTRSTLLPASSVDKDTQSIPIGAPRSTIQILSTRNG